MKSYFQEFVMDFTKTRLYLKAEGGDKDAMCYVAQCYYTGSHVNQNLKKAIEWYQKASDAGSSDASVNLAIFYQEGEGIPKNTQKAFEIINNASTNPGATSEIFYTLGQYYSFATGVGKNNVKALECYLKAANMDSITEAKYRAMYNIGVAYEQGIGTTENISEAID